MNHSMACGDAEVLRQIAHKPKSEMRATLAIQLKDRMAGGRYAPPAFKEDYREPIRGQPELSYYNSNTPKMWPIRTTRQGSPDASPGKSVNGGISVLSDYTGAFPRGSATIHPTYRGFGASVARGCSKAAEDGARDDDSSFLSVTSPISSVFANSEKTGFLSTALTRSEEPLTRDKPLTALQQTLLTCGKIKHGDKVMNDPIREKVSQAISRSYDGMRSHADWLQEKESRRGAQVAPRNKDLCSIDDGSVFGGDSMYSKQPSKTAANRSHETKGVTAGSSKMSTVSSKRHRTKALYSGIYNDEMPADGIKAARSIKGYQEAHDLEDRLEQLHASLASGEFDKRLSHASYARTCDIGSLMSELTRPSYSSVVLSNIGAAAPDKLGNPYRQLNSGKHMEVRGSPSLDSLSVGGGKGRDSSIISGGSTRSNSNTNSRIYSKSQKVCGVGSYTVTIRAPRVAAGGSLSGGNTQSRQPALRDVTESTALLSRKQLLAYDTRIVETGALLKALQDLKHKNPGLTAIISLHRNMVASAIINPNPYFISRSQLRDVIYANVPWMNKDAIGRLISSYDPYQTGFVRYIRLSSSIIAGNRPSMSGLISSLNNGSKAEDPHGVGLVLALIFGLYQDCEGQQATGLSGKFISGGDANGEAKGMKLADIREALSCCVCSAADEVAIFGCADVIIQELFDTMQTTGPGIGDGGPDDNSVTSLATSVGGGRKAHASVMLSHGTLASMAHVGIVSQDDLTRAVMENRPVYDEFSRQLLQFRGLVAHFAHVGSVSYARAKLEKSIYGTQRF